MTQRKYAQDEMEPCRDEILKQIQRAGTLSVRYLQREMHFTDADGNKTDKRKPSIALVRATLDQMQRDGLIELQETSDERYNDVSLTQLGKAQAAGAMVFTMEEIDAALGGLLHDKSLLTLIKQKLTSDHDKSAASPAAG